MHAMPMLPLHKLIDISYSLLVSVEFLSTYLYMSRILIVVHLYPLKLNPTSQMFHKRPFKDAMPRTFKMHVFIQILGTRLSQRVITP